MHLIFTILSANIWVLISHHEHTYFEKHLSINGPNRTILGFCFLNTFEIYNRFFRKIKKLNTLFTIESHFYLEKDIQEVLAMGNTGNEKQWRQSVTLLAKSLFVAHCQHLLYVISKESLRSINHDNKRINVLIHLYLHVYLHAFLSFSLKLTSVKLTFYLV